LLNAVTGEKYTVEQVVTAMACCGAPERKLAVPDFFKDVVEQDVGTEKKNTVEIVESLNNLLVETAMINGDFTLKEANCVSNIIDNLTQYGVSHGTNLFAPTDNFGKVTEMKLDTYLQNDAIMEKTKEQKKENTKGTSNTDASTGKSTEDNTPINITINFARPNSEPQDEKGTTKELSDNPPDATKEDERGEETMESLLEELDSLVGLETVKRDVHSLINFIKVAKIREKRGMKVPIISYHLVFTGNPGTGKTTVARLVAKLYYHMGILPQGQLVEADRSTLVAGYLGQTAIKTQKVIQQAMGGVLFIDEAYSLAGDEQDSYGKEAIETILKAMEDHRDELVVIVAGYTDLMHKFIESNPGLSSRFSKYFEYPDYTGEELVTIFQRFCEKNGYVLSQDAYELLKNKFDLLYENRDKHFGNARTARNIFEKSINAQADRIATQSFLSDSDLENITIEDILTAIGGVR
jgi:SpoVK/Ycf46/Vps4 family AAA+-type ATPase